jgi:Antitoxin VbhA
MEKPQAAKPLDRMTRKRQVAIASALASQRMEGLEPDAATLSDALRWANGEISIAEAIAKLRSRALTPSA